MEALLIAAKEDSPGVIFNPQNGIFEFNYRSLPEDAASFYSPIFEWLEKYKSNPLPKSIFQFKLEYFNTTSAKQIYKMFCLLQEISKKAVVEIKWYYQEEDHDMCAAGERYSKLIDMPFTIIAY